MLVTIISACTSTTEAHANLREKKEEKRKTWSVTSSSKEENNAVDLASARYSWLTKHGGPSAILGSALLLAALLLAALLLASCRHTFRVVVQILQCLSPAAPSFDRSAALPKCTSRAGSWAATFFSLEFAEVASESVLERL